VSFNRHLSLAIYSLKKVIKINRVHNYFKDKLVYHDFDIDKKKAPPNVRLD